MLMAQLTRPARYLIAAMVAAVALTVPRVAFAQLRMSFGAGAGIAGTTDASLSEGRTAPIVMAEVAAMANAVGLGLEVDAWHRDASSSLIANGDLHIRIPSTPVVVKFGAGVGRWDSETHGTITGTAAHIGATYDIGFSAARALTLFANGFLVYSPLQSQQLVDAGLAFTWR
jgi:hypothetical protein